MRVYQTNEIKNIALLGSAGSGKTTLAESMLFEAGVIKRRGSVEAKNTVSDYFPVELEYGYSVFPTVFHVEWNNKKLNIIDCPGSDDFVGGAITSLNVTDQAVILINGQYGPEVGTQNNFRYTEKLNKPVIFLVNQLDSDKCDFDNLIATMKDIYGSKCVQIQYPIETGPGFNALIDVLLMKKYSWKPEGGAPIIEDIPEEEMDKAMELHAALVEAAAENDEGLMEKFFESESLTEDELREGIRKGLVTRSIFPVFCVCAGKSMGVHRLMEFLGNVVPFVSEMPKVHNTRGEEITPDTNGPESVYFFKTGLEPHIGEVSYFKVMSGSIKSGDDLTNSDRGSKERIGQIYACAGANRVPVDKLNAGDIGCTVKMKDVKTGNTLNGKGAEWRFDFIKYPNPKYSRAIKAVNAQDTEKLMAALLKMRQEDPTWVVDQSKELRQVIVRGQGEFHLRTLKWRLENNEKLNIVFEEPRIPYRETITKKARADYRHKKQSGGSGQYGDVHIKFSPSQQEFEFTEELFGGSVPKQYVPAVEKGLLECMEKGPLAGCKVQNVKATLYDGSYHPVDSNEAAFKIAASLAFKKGIAEAKPCLLEPIMKLEITVPDDCVGAGMGDLPTRRGAVMGMDPQIGGGQTLHAEAPQAELFDYAIALRSMTQARGSFTMEFARYEEVPAMNAQKIIEAHKAEEEDK